MSRTEGAASITETEFGLQARLQIFLGFQSVAPGHRFKFDSNCVLDGHDRSRLELERRQHRTKLVNREWIVAVHQHVPAPLTHAYDKHFNLEIGGRRKTSRIVFGHSRTQQVNPGRVRTN